MAICVIAFSVFVVISFMIFNAWAAFMVMIIVVSMTVELAGFMGVTGVKLNPVSAVTLITAVGIGKRFNLRESYIFFITYTWSLGLFRC